MTEPEIKLAEEEQVIQEIYNKMHPRHKNFVKEYIIDFNETRAYAKAFAREKDPASNASASRLLRDVNIRKVIQYEIAKKFDNVDLTAEEVLNKLKQMMRSTFEDIVEWKGNKMVIKDSSELSEAQKWLVSEVSETKEGLKVKLVSKEKAIEFLMKYFGLLTEKIEHSGSVEHKVKVYVPENKRR